MHAVPLADQLYVEVQRAAAACGVSVEKYVAEAVQLHLGDGPEEQNSITLTPDQVAIIRRSQADIAAGKGISLD